MNNTTIKFYRELKLAVNTLLYAFYQKTHEKILEFFENLPPFLFTTTILKSYCSHVSSTFIQPT